MKIFLKRSAAVLLVFLCVFAVAYVPPSDAVTGPETSVVQVAAGENHVVVLLDDGSVWAWGDNTYGQVGDGTNYTRSLPVMIIPEEGFTVDGATLTVSAVAAGANHSFAILSDGHVIGWGNNRYGQLGDSTTGNRNRPVPVKKSASEYFMTTPWGANETPNLEAGFAHTLAIDADGKLYGWGYNAFGQLGNGKNTNALTPVFVKFVPDSRDEETRQIVESTIDDQPSCDIIAAGYNHSVAYAGGVLYGFGNNTAGQLGLGIGDYKNRNIPQEIPDAPTPDYLQCGNAHSLMISGNTLYGWGSNAFGQLQLENDAKTITSPEEVLSDVAEMRGGYNHNVILLGDGTVMTLGFNSRGQIGNGYQELSASSQIAEQADPEFEPERDINNPDFGKEPDRLAINAVQVAAGYYFSIIVDQEGQIWLWGDNGYGQLGDGTFLRRLRPNMLPTRVFYDNVKTVSEVVLSKRKVIIGIGEEFSDLLTATVKPADALYGTITWTTSNSDVCTIVEEPFDETAEDYVESEFPQSRVRLIGNKRTGTAVITATAYNGKSLTATVQVKPTPNYVKITTKPTRMLGVGKSYHLGAEVQNLNSFDPRVEWSLVDSIDGDLSDDLESENNIAVIDPDTGLLTATDVGTVYVQARSVMDHTVFDVIQIDCGVFSTKVVVYEEPFDPDANMSPLSQCTIYINYAEKPKPDYGTKTLYATLFTEDSNLLWQEKGEAAVRWFSENPEVADVDPETGEVTAKKPGRAAIIAASKDKATRATVSVYVKPLGESINCTSSDVKPYDESGTAGKLTVFAGKSFQVSTYVLARQAVQTTKWDPSPDATVATVSDRGLVTGQGPGEVELVCHTVDYLEMTGASPVEYHLFVTVLAPVERIQFDPNKLYLLSGDEYDLAPIVTPYNASVLDSGYAGAPFTWKSNNYNCVSVDDSGHITANSPGSARITCTATDGSKASGVINVYVNAAPDSIQIKAPAYEPDVPIIATKGKSVKLKAAVYPAAASQDIIWSVTSEDDTAVAATISATGVLNVTGTGVVRVRAAAAADPDGVYVEDLLVKCVVPARTFKITPVKATVTQGKTLHIDYTMQPEEVSNPDPRYKPEQFDTIGLTVPSGDVFPDNEAQTFIETTNYGFDIEVNAEPGTYKVKFYADGKEAELTLIVKSPPEGVTVTKIPAPDEELDAVLVWKGKKYQLAALVEPVTADQKVEWFSDDDSIVSIDSKGFLKGVSPGETEIWCSPAADPEITSDRYKVVCDVEVASIKFKPSLDIKAIAGGAPFDVDVIVSPADAYKNTDWEFETKSDGAVTSVNRVDGADFITITPEAYGSDTITVKLGGKKATLKVKVYDDPAGIEITTPPRADDNPLVKGKTLALRARVEPSTAQQTVYWESSDPSIARVDKNGSVTVVGSGAAQIRAYTLTANGTEVEATYDLNNCKVPLSGLKADTASISLSEAVSDYEINITTRPDDAFVSASSKWKARSSGSKYVSATVDENGNGDGTATVKIHLEDTPPKAATYSVTVTYAGKSVAISVRVPGAPKE